MLLRSKYFFYTFFFITSCVFSQQFRNASNYSDVNIYQDNNGVAVADYDLDGDLDIFIVGSFSEENNDFTWSRLLQNTNNGNFIDVTAGTGIEQTLNHDIILNDIGFLDLQQDFGDRLSRITRFYFFIIFLIVPLKLLYEIDMQIHLDPPLKY